MGHKEDLLEGAIACIQERGYAATTARDIVAASGSNLGAIGYHYGSKEALLDAAVLEGFRRWLDPLIASCCDPAGGDPWRRLQDGLDELLRSLEHNRRMVVGLCEALTRAERDESLRRQLADGYRELRTALATSVREALDLEDAAAARTTATLLIAVADGLVTQALLDPDEVPDGVELLRSAGVAFAKLGPSP